MRSKRQTDKQRIVRSGACVVRSLSWLDFATFLVNWCAQRSTEHDINTKEKIISQRAKRANRNWS